MFPTIKQNISNKYTTSFRGFEPFGLFPTEQNQQSPTNENNHSTGAEDGVAVIVTSQPSL